MRHASQRTKRSAHPLHRKVTLTARPLTPYLASCSVLRLLLGVASGVERWRLNRREADDLRRIGLELREAVGDYTSKSSDGPAIERAKAAALKLKAVLGDFDSIAPRNVDQGQDYHRPAAYRQPAYRRSGQRHGRQGADRHS